MQARDFLSTSRKLAGSGMVERPLETDLRRAVSTTYYALFRCLATCCANMIAGVASAHRSRSWRQTYRALQHATARRRCENRNILTRFPVEIQDFANLFIDMQKKRHRADYDPDRSFFLSRPAVMQDINETEEAIRRFLGRTGKIVELSPVYLLLDLRKD